MSPDDRLTIRPFGVRRQNFPSNPNDNTSSGTRPSHRLSQSGHDPTNQIVVIGIDRGRLKKKFPRRVTRFGSRRRIAWCGRDESRP